MSWDACEGSGGVAMCLYDGDEEGGLALGCLRRTVWVLQAGL